MQVAFLTHEPFYPPTGGGSAEAYYLVRELRRRGHGVHVFAPPSAHEAETGENSGVVFHPFRRWAMGRRTRWRTLKYLLYPRALAQSVLAAAPIGSFDWVWAQHAISSAAAGRVKRALGLPVVMNQLDFLTGFMETWPVWRMPPPLLAALERYELSLPNRYRADVVLAVSDALADRIAGTGYPRARLRAIHYGYDPLSFPFRGVGWRPVEGRPPVVVMHGSFDRHHLGPIALEAATRVRETCPEAVFRFVGPETEALRQFLKRAMARLGGRGWECTGFVPYEGLGKQLAEASVGMVPYEASAGVHSAFVAKVVEYLGVGLPVVCTSLDGIRRFFSAEPRIRFTPFEGRFFGEQILYWLGQPPGAAGGLAQAASRRVQQELDWAEVCRGAVDFAESLLR